VKRTTDWPQAVMFIVLFSSMAGASIAITAIVLKHRRLMAGLPGMVATVLDARHTP